MIDRIRPTPTRAQEMNYARGRVPSMSVLVMDAEQREAVHTIALDIFVTMVNAGAPMQSAIAAVYMSGLQHGSAALGGGE